MFMRQSVAVIMLAIMMMACSVSEQFDSLIGNAPTLKIGSDLDNMANRHDVYKFINNYFVDSQENIYIADTVDVQVDEYDSLGNYVKSVGRRGQGPGEFQYISSFVVSSDGGLRAQSSDFRLTCLDASGRYIKSIELPDPYRTSYCADMEIDSQDRMYMVIVTTTHACVLQIDNDEFKIIHLDEKKTSLDFTKASFLPLVKPDIALDGMDNLYVLDSVFYKVYRYDSSGHLLRTFEKKDAPKKIDRSDFVFAMGAEVMDARNQYNEAMSDLDGWKQYLPTLFGINVDEANIYLWTSEMQTDGRFVVDIYDKDFRFKKKALCYNLLMDNKVRIRNNNVYMPNISPQDTIKGGRFSVHVMPYKLEVYNLNLHSAPS